MTLDDDPLICTQLMGKPDVQTAIGDLMEMKGIGRNFRVDKLGKPMRHPDPVVSLKALDMGFNLSGDKEAAQRQTPEKLFYPEINIEIFRTD
jgi:hypothetical protein